MQRAARSGRNAQRFGAGDELARQRVLRAHGQALGMYWWVKGSTLVDAGTLAIMNELHVPAGACVHCMVHAT